LKRKLLFSILAAIAAALLPLGAVSQVTTSSGTIPGEKPEVVYKYHAFVGYGYTSLNQVNQSRSGLQGVNASITRDFGKYFGLTADGSYYKYAITSGNPGDPSVEMVLFGPEFHAPIWGHISGFAHGLIGGEHTGGNRQTPNISFAGGVGAGLDYSINSHFALRAYGDNILSSFSLIDNSPKLGYSPHERGNARGAFGVIYSF
jgi:hypothetical protein